MNSNYEEVLVNYGDDRFDERIFLNCIKDSEYFSYHADNYCFTETDSESNAGDFVSYSSYFIVISQYLIVFNLQINKNKAENKFQIESQKPDNIATTNLLNVLIRNHKCEPSETLTEFLNGLEVNQNQKKLLNMVRECVNETFKNVYLSSCLKVRLRNTRIGEYLIFTNKVIKRFCNLEFNK